MYAFKNTPFLVYAIRYSLLFTYTLRSDLLHMYATRSDLLAKYAIRSTLLSVYLSGVTCYVSRFPQQFASEIHILGLFNPVSFAITNLFNPRLIVFLFTGTNTVKISDLNFGCKVMYSGSVTFCRRVKCLRLLRNIFGFTSKCVFSLHLI